MSQALLQSSALIDFEDMTAGGFADQELAAAATEATMEPAQEMVPEKRGLFTRIMDALAKGFAPPPGCEMAYYYWP